MNLGHKESFFSYLTERADDYQLADITISGNAVYPTIWSWEVEARRTPLRTVRHRIRLKDELLQLMLTSQDLRPPPVTVP